MANDALMLRDRYLLIGRANDYLLYFVKLVDAVQSARVAPIGACFTSVARRHTDVAFRQLGLIQDLVTVICGQRHLGGTDQVHRILLDAIGLLLTAREIG